MDKQMRLVLLPFGSSWDALDTQPAQAEGAPLVRRYRKELIRTGTYEFDDGEVFEITDEVLLRWYNAALQMRANGVRVPLSDSPVPHDDTGNPQNVVGQIVDWELRPGVLVGTLEVVGEEAIREALSNDVSIYVPGSEVEDGLGRSYGEAITHVALTPYPRSPGLGPWQAVAASLKVEMDGDNKPDGQEDAEKGEQDMDIVKMAQSLGLDDAENATEEAVLEALTALVEQRDELTTEKKAHETAMSEKVAEVEALKMAQSGTEPDPMTVSLASKNREMALDMLVPGKVSPATRDALLEVFGTEEAVAFSITSGEGNKRFEGMVKALAGNVPVEPGEQSGAQLPPKELPDDSKDTPDGFKASMDADIERRREEAAAKGLTVPK